MPSRVVVELPRILFDQKRGKGYVYDTSFRRKEEQDLPDILRRHLPDKEQDMALRCVVKGNF